MYKLDFEIGNIYSTLRMVEQEKSKIDKMTQAEKDGYSLDETKFTELRKQQISKQYGEMGGEMLKHLQLRPAKAIPIIYDRLKVSYKRTVDEKNDLLKSWHDQCEKNFLKSLDHRSFHFK